MAIEHELDSALAEAVRIARSQSAFGRWIGKRQSVVHGWLKEGKPLPAEHVLTVERNTGIPRTRLRPDLYPVEEAPHPADLPASGAAGSANRRNALPLGEPVR